MTESTKHRELTRAECAEIRKLVKGLCANYDNEYGCLLLDGDCYMFYGVAYTNTGMCKYFRNAVLPTNPVLEAVLTSVKVVETRPCGICCKAFPADGKKLYCSDACAGEAHRRRNRDNKVSPLSRTVRVFNPIHLSIPLIDQIAPFALGIDSG